MQLQQYWHFYCFAILSLTSTVIHSVKQRLLRNRPGSALRPLATSCAKDYKAHSLYQTSFAESPNSISFSFCVCVLCKMQALLNGNRSRTTSVTVCKQQQWVSTHSSHGIIFQMPGLSVVFSGTTQGSNSHPHGTDWLCKWKRACQILFPPLNTAAFLHGTVGVTSLPDQGPRARCANQVKGG